MKVLFINGSVSDSSINSYVRSAIDSLSANGHDAKELVLRDMKYSPCKGCFNCWVKTPGICVFKDDGDNICREFITSDMVVLSSPIIMATHLPGENAWTGLYLSFTHTLRTSTVRYTT